MSNAQLLFEVGVKVLGELAPALIIVGCTLLGVRIDRYLRARSPRSYVRNQPKLVGRMPRPTNQPTKEQQ